MASVYLISESLPFGWLDGFLDGVIQDNTHHRGPVPCPMLECGGPEPLRYERAEYACTLGPRRMHHLDRRSAFRKSCSCASLDEEDMEEERRREKREERRKRQADKKKEGGNFYIFLG